MVEGPCLSPPPVCPVPVQRDIHRAELAELAALFLLHGMGMAVWFVPLTLVLEAHGFGALRPYAFATSAVAAFVSPLVFGAVADRHVAPTRVLRWLAVATAGTLVLASTAIRWRAAPGLVLGLIQLHALGAAPTTSLASTIVLARLTEAPRQFGPIRAMATFGWMAGCWLVSALKADASTVAGYAGALVWLALAAFTWLLPSVEPPALSQASAPISIRRWHRWRRVWCQRLGLDALSLLAHRDHRVVFLTTALFSMPLAAFYPYTPPQLRELGLERAAAWMSLGQVSEVATLLGLSALLTRWRLKWILGAGLAIGLIRYLLCALNGRPWLLGGVFLHGVSFALFFITAQIYVGERVEPAWRARAQALLTLMMSGVGNLIGYLGTGAWFNRCTSGGATQWPRFWGGLAAVIAAVLLGFLVAYRGRRAQGATFRSPSAAGRQHSELTQGNPTNPDGSA